MVTCSSSVRGYGAQVIRELAAGEPVTLTVELAEGDASFDLSIAEQPGAVCMPTLVASGGGSAAELVKSYGNHLNASCAAAGGLDLDSRQTGFVEARIELAYTGSNAGCNVMVESEFPAAVYLLENDCGGTEVRCVTSDAIGSPTSFQTKVNVPPSPEAKDYVLVIESTDPNRQSGTFSYYMSCVL